MNWKKMIANDTFIGRYLDYTSNLETSEDFDFWSCIWILSLLINRNLYIDRPNMPVYMNFYITLLAESGIARKSSAVNFAKSVLEDILNEKYSYLQVLTGTTSQQKFAYAMTKASFDYKKCIIGLNISEFITFFKNKNIIECFTDLYDCPKERKGYGTFTNGDINVRDVFVSSLSASTPNYYLKAVSEEEIEGGFTSRNIIVHAEKGKKRIPWGTEKSTENLITEGRHIRQFIQNITSKQTIILTDKAIRRYSQWYLRRRLAEDLYTRSFESREQDFVLKLAGILAINDYKTKIELYHIEYAIKIISYYKKQAQKFFNKEVYADETDDMTKLIVRIRDIIHSKGQNGIQHRDLYLRIHNSCSNDLYNYIINVMHELNLIEKLQVYGSKAVVYRETKDIYKLPVDKIIKNINVLN